MAIGSVRAKEYLEELQYGQSRRTQGKERGGFQEGIRENQKAQAKEEAKEQTSVYADHRSGRLAAEMLMQGMSRWNLSAITESTVRHITNEESDLIKLYPAEGYMLKVQVDLDSHSVYVEQKSEDGTYQAYDINPFLVSEQTKSPITQIAMEAWAKAREAEGAEETKGADGRKEDADADDLTEFEKRLEEFKAYVKQRIKEGPLKITIGGSEFSEEEWEKLLHKIDRDIDAYKEELRERIRRRKEEDEIQKSSRGIVDSIEEAADEVTGTVSVSGGILGEPVGEGLTISENEALEEAGQKAPRGSSLFARLSGEKKAPYSYLADATGKIVYKGVTFFCDDKKGQICLGDMSNPKNVINIPLAKGGCLRVNRDNIGDLAKAISMFSAEDIGRIMRAIAQDKKAQEVEWELETSKGRGV